MEIQLSRQFWYRNVFSNSDSQMQQQIVSYMFGLVNTFYIMEFTELIFFGKEFFTENNDLQQCVTLAHSCSFSQFFVMKLAHRVQTTN